jgi:hypothetical protein
MKHSATVLAIACLSPLPVSALTCPPMPDPGTYHGQNVKSLVDGSLGSIGTLKAAALSVHTEVSASALFGQFPGIDQIIVLQTMSATYCSMLIQSGLTPFEIVARWETFQDKVLKLKSETADAPTRKREEPPAAPPKPPRVTADVGPNRGPVERSQPDQSSRFVKTTCGTILDNATHLEWMIGEDRSLNFEEARRWVGGLSACGGGWQMPVASELRALFIRESTAGVGYETGGKRWPAHLDPAFAPIGSGSWVWSYTSAKNTEPIFYNFNQGVAVENFKYKPEYSTRAFAVR